MRPVRLNMEGFASFRSHTVVDFEGADYFALTGPTGSGKSTVIDGIVFALYGTAPRWGGANVVRYALAPTVNRATVNLVFDLGSERYQVAREVRRSGKQLSQRSASLERIVDPADPSEVEVLASDAVGVTMAVEKLLGISLDEFCKAVVLPQGEFAEFLRATPTARQDILLKLLGSQVYDDVRAAAGERQQIAHERVVAQDAQLVELADATPESVAAAAARRHELAALESAVLEESAKLATARDAAKAAASERGIREARSDLLEKVEVPAGVTEFGERATQLQAALAAAKVKDEQATRAYDAARAALDQAGDRSALERLQGWWKRHDELEHDLPGLAQDAATAISAADAAEKALVQAQEAWQSTKEELGVAERSVASTRHDQRQLQEKRDCLANTVKPEGLDDLSTRLAGATWALKETETAVQRAEGDDAAARREATSVGAEAPLKRQLELLDRWCQLQTDITQTQSAQEAAGERLVQLLAQRERAEAAAAAAEAELRSAQDRQGAAELRAHLVVGDDCPVCTQRIAVLPPPLGVDQLERAEANRSTTNAALGEAQRALVRAETESESTASALAGLLDQSEHLGVRLGAGEDDLNESSLRAELTSRLAAVRLAQERLDEAGATLIAAREERDAAASAEQSLAGEAVRARKDLRSARESLLPLGAPAVDDADPASGWNSLLDWAASEITTLDSTALPESLESVRAAEAALERARNGLRTQDDARGAAQGAAKSSTELATRERASYERAQSEEKRLAELLAHAPSLADVDAQLREWQRLADLERNANQERQAARGAHEDAQKQRTTFETERQAALEALRAVRAQLVPLGAPALDESDLAAAWHTLTEWAASATAAAVAAVIEAQSACDAAAAAVTALETRLLETAEAGDVQCTTTDQVVPNVAGALGQARHALELLEKQSARREEILLQRKEAVRTQQVAELLATHLRSQRFPRWLAGAALDVLVAAASESLMELSGGQFSLTHDDKEFAVIDHADAEAQRSVRTLSGGETFQASLALALALSGEFSSLSSASSRLDSIFLDEGFGTLDADSLETVAETLERLAHSDRMVGVVTHVSSLAERIPTRYLVSRNSRTSTVVREG